MNQSLSLTFKGVNAQTPTKTFTIKFPNMGQLIDAEGIKGVLTNGRYSIIAFGTNPQSAEILNFVDGCAYFYAHIGQPFLELFGCNSVIDLNNLTKEQGKIISNLFINDYHPFYSQVDTRQDRIIASPVQENKNEEHTEKGPDDK